MKTDDIKLFHRIVECGSIIATADLLHVPKSTVSRRLLSLEQDIGCKLFHRQNRSITLTSAGAHFYKESLKSLSLLENTLSEITSKEAKITSHLRILLFPLPNLIEILEAVFQFMDLHPHLSVEMIITSEPLDMIKNNIDVAFMIEETFTETDMVAKPVSTQTLRFLASPDYLERHGEPKTIEDIQQHEHILFRFPNGRIFDQVPISKNKSISVKGRLCVNSMPIALSAAIQGRGIAYIPLTICKREVDKGLLKVLFPDTEPYIGTCFLVYPSRRYLSSATTRFIDYMMNTITIDGKPKAYSDEVGDVWY